MQQKNSVEEVVLLCHPFQNFLLLHLAPQAEVCCSEDCLTHFNIQLLPLECNFV